LLPFRFNRLRVVAQFFFVRHILLSVNGRALSTATGPVTVPIGAPRGAHQEGLSRENT
jgi:hypothetical protein